jgi:hypothetical protein
MYSAGKLIDMSDTTVFPTGMNTGRNAMPALAPFYYLKNFELVLSTILGRYADLLLADELKFITDFSHAPLRSRALLTRLVMRRGDLFREGKVSYAEIGDTRAAAAALIEAGWISDRPMLRIDQLHSILTKEELISCLKLPRRYAAWRKSELLEMLKVQFTRPRDFSDWHPDASDCVYALRIAPVCERFRLMFFGNDRQSWTEFVTADLKIFNYEKVERTLRSRPFKTRAQIETYLQLQDCRELLQAGMPLDDLMQIFPQVIEDSEWLEDRRQKLLFSVAREYERNGEKLAAQTMYLDCTHRGARARAMRLKARASDWEGTRALCLDAIANPESEAELQQVRRVLPRAMRKLGLDPDTGRASPVIPEFELVFDGPRAAGAVECHVRDHLGRELADCNTVRYVENGLVNGLFGLLCWPAIFAPIPGAFFHDFHHGPSDLESSHFYRRRKSAFDNCLGLLESGGYRQAIWKVFKHKWGIQSPFVRWHHLDETLLQWALHCFPPAHLRVWFEWIVRDVRENRAGFPDLVQFWPAERKYRMIEVKGPGDRVQDNQKRLLEHCVFHEIPVWVCHVRWSDGLKQAVAHNCRSQRIPAQPQE